MNDDDDAPGAERAPPRLPLLLGGLLLGAGGFAKHTALIDCAAATVGGRRTPTQWVIRSTKAMRDLELIERGEDGVWYVLNMAELAGWVADGWAAREDAGYCNEPERPAFSAAA